MCLLHALYASDTNRPEFSYQTERKDAVYISELMSNVCQIIVSHVFDEDTTILIIILISQLYRILISKQTICFKGIYYT